MIQVTSPHAGVALSKVRLQGNSSGRKIPPATGVAWNTARASFLATDGSWML